jgi:hypothetical protein
VTSKELITKLAIVDQNILSEAAQQPILFMDAAQYRVSAMRVRAEAVAEIESRRARLTLKKRAEKDDMGRKVTEGEIKAGVESTKIIGVLRARVDRSYEREELAKLILEAYRQRREAIRVIAEAENLGLIRGSKEVENIQQRKKVISNARLLEQKRRRLEHDDNDEL